MMTPAERNAGMADLSLSGLMEAARQDQEVAVAKARKAALEEAARWHDAKVAQILRTYEETTRINRDGNRPLVIATIAEVHRTSAAAIRALKEQEPTT